MVIIMIIIIIINTCKMVFSTNVPFCINFIKSIFSFKNIVYDNSLRPRNNLKCNITSMLLERYPNKTPGFEKKFYLLKKQNQDM